MDERLDPAVFWPRLREALVQVPEDARTPPPEARVGAVLVLLEDTPEGPRVVLTRRRRDMRSHPGQVSFPGGRLDPGESVDEAALREAREEIGLRGHTVEIVGVGPKFYIPPSRFWVVPVLARWRQPHPLTENPWEVDEVLEVPLTQLLDRSRWRHAPLSLRGSTWAWQLDADILWGATAIVMALLLDTAVEGWSGGLQPHELGEKFAVRPWEQVPSWERRVRLEGELPSRSQAEVEHVAAAQVRQVREWLDGRGVGPLVRAEQAGRAAAHALRRLHGGDLADVTITVLAGPSENGAGGLAAARLLVAAGAGVEVVTVGPPRHPQQLAVLEAAGVPLTSVTAETFNDARAPGQVVLDAMLGVGTEPPLRDLPEVAATWLRRHDVPVVSLDLPTGLSADAGVRGPCVTADVTVAIGAPTRGLAERISHAYVGDLYLADLGVPPAAWRAAGVSTPPTFSSGPLVRLTADDVGTDAGTPDQGQL
ncbi:NAD(P)H-hydrate epimerase [Egicoccus sp. AB-alg6-2]|uniref:NAD(P)H-hydrate epimerase n=1 Tax=Egicoccus sp. AB-alg6-2 TaxID=3242692 RepID=UPI00359D63E5